MTVTIDRYNNLLKNSTLFTKNNLQNSAKFTDWVFVGTDFSGQENVNLSELLIPYDNGRLDEIINKGSKEEGTDLHSLNAKACGVSRTEAKPVWFNVQ